MSMNILKAFFFLHSDTQPPTKADQFTLPPTIYEYTQIFVNWNILNNGNLIWIYSHLFNAKDE